MLTPILRFQPCEKYIVHELAKTIDGSLNNMQLSLLPCISNTHNIIANVTTEIMINKAGWRTRIHVADHKSLWKLLLYYQIT